MASVIYFRIGDVCPCCPGRFIQAIDYQNDQFMCCGAVGGTRRRRRFLHAGLHERVYVGFDPGFETVTPVLDLSRFPHKCPRCGTSCYIGVNTEHAIGALDTTCR